MQFQKITIVAACAALALSSCVRNPGESASRGVLYNNEIKVDSEGFSFFKVVHGTAAYEVELADYIQSTAGSSAVRELASRVVETYQSILPELVEMAAGQHVVLPDPGAPVFHVEATTDSLQAADLVNEQNYIAHVQQQQKLILEQFTRADRNTNKVLNRYAQEKLPIIKELYAAAGGEEANGAHH